MASWSLRLEEGEDDKPRTKEGFPLAIIRGKCSMQNKIVFAEKQEHDASLPSEAQFCYEPLVKRSRKEMKEEAAEAAPSAEGKNCIRLPQNAKFELIPCDKKERRHVIYAAGQSGCGKSMMGGAYARNYQKVHRGREVLILSKKPKDKAIDGIPGSKRLDIDSDVVYDQPKFNKETGDFKWTKCLFVIDDVDTLEPLQQACVAQLVDDIAAIGRAGEISMFIMAHKLTNYQKTRLLLNEATHFVLFPEWTTKHNMTYLLKDHLGMDDDEIAALGLTGAGRWVCFHKAAPRYLMGERVLRLL